MKSPNHSLHLPRAILVMVLIHLSLMGSSECPPPIDGDGDGYSPDQGDCNDLDASTYPGAPEICDGHDNDCNGEVDESANLPWYLDADRDGYGESGGRPYLGCSPPSDGYAVNDMDCNDTDASVNPGVLDTCNGLDDDCDGLIDNEADQVWFPDDDGDGYGDEAGGMRTCEPPRGYIRSRGDCDDADPAVHPFANEVSRMDGRDQDCGGTDGPDPSVASPTQSIQDALNSAQPGQVVWVGPGTYHEYDLDFLGKEVTLISTQLQENTIIDADHQGPVFRFDHGETLATRLDGFTLTNGDWEYGGGAYLESSSPTFANVTLSENSGTCGGGMYMDSSSPVLTNVVFAGNRAQEGQHFAMGYGGAMYLTWSDPTLTHVIFSGNSSIGEAGGMLINTYSSPVITDALFSGNSSTGRGGGMFVNGGSTPVLTNVIFSANSSYWGGGMALEGTKEILTNVWVAWNTARYYGGGIEASISAAVLTNVVIEGNWAQTHHSGGLYVLYEVDPTLTNTIITNNRAPTDGGVVIESSDGTTFRNVIIAYNSGYNLSTDAYSNPTLTYCDLYPAPGQGNYAGLTLGDTNYTSEPGFLDYDSHAYPTNFHLALTSPLVNHGDPAIFDPDRSPSDVGAFGGPSADDWDLDADGYPNWFWPGTLQDAPTGFDPADFDADDQNASVH